MENADLPGFPSTEQALLAFLIENQRRELRLRTSRRLPSAWRERALKLSLLLRIAVLLNRSRANGPLAPVRLKAGKSYVRVTFPEGWLARNPLTAADLERERGYLHKIGFDLRFD